MTSQTENVKGGQTVEYKDQTDFRLKKKIYKLWHGQENGTSRQRTKRSRNINNVVSHHEKGKIVEKEGSNSGDRMLWQWSEKNWKKEKRTI